MGSMHFLRTCTIEMPRKEQGAVTPLLSKRENAGMGAGSKLMLLALAHCQNHASCARMMEAGWRLLLRDLAPCVDQASVA